MEGDVWIMKVVAFSFLLGFWCVVVVDYGDKKTVEQ